MTVGRVSRLLGGLVSLVSTAALLVGVPVLLVVGVGWPLPADVPSLGTLEQAARSGISDEVIVNTLAVIAWLAWSQFAAALAVEILAVARGRQAIRLPVLPGFQVTAARLVGGILLIGSTLQPARAHALSIASLASVAANEVATGVPPDTWVRGSTSPTAGVSSIASDAAPTDAASGPRPSVTVQRHDSYWAIAERTLGDGLRWREILDLNVGRTLPDGTIIAAGDDTLLAGWILLLPEDATPEATDASTGGDVRSTDHDSPVTALVERGDNLWTIAEDRLEDDLAHDPSDREVAPYWREVIDANEDRYVEPGNPNLIHPGQVFLLPPTGLEPPTAPPPQAEPTPSVGESTTSTVPPLPPAPDRGGLPEDGPQSSTTTVPPVEAKVPHSPLEPPAPTSADGIDADLVVSLAVGGLSSIALAVGLKRLLDRRRRRFANEHPGQMAGRTPPEQRDLHQAVVAQADEERIDDLQGVLGRLAASLAGSSSARRPRMIRHSDSSLEVLLDRPDTEAPAGWTSSDDGTVWTLAVVPDPDDPYDGPLCPTPLLVTIGEPDDDAQLHLDLEADGLLALTGDRDTATNLARSIVTELTLSPLADTLRIIAVGDIVDNDAKVLEHLTIFDSWEVVAEDLLAWAAQSHKALVENAWANAFIGRGHDPDNDALVPIAVIADRPPSSEVLDALQASLPSAVAVVVVGAFEGAAATVRCEPDALNLDAADLACEPQELTADELSEMCQLLVATDSPDEQGLLDELRTQYEAEISPNEHEPVVEAQGAPDETIPLAPDEPPSYDVFARLLGDITVEGAQPLKPKPTAVAAYIALNRAVSTERLEEACWFGSDGASHRKRLRDVMTEIRDALGSQHFPANRSGAYVAGPRVRTDAELFEWHVQRAAKVETTDAVDHYRAALDLVTSRPFSYPNAARASYGWVDFEHHSTTWEYKVAHIAQAYTELLIDVGAPGEAITTLRRLARAIPLSSAIVETLMRAHIATDDRSGAESVYREHAKALAQADLGDPEDSIEQLRLDLEAT